VKVLCLQQFAFFQAENYLAFREKLCAKQTFNRPTNKLTTHEQHCGETESVLLMDALFLSKSVVHPVQVWTFLRVAQLVIRTLYCLKEQAPLHASSVNFKRDEQNSGANTSWQNKPHETSTEDRYLENNQNDSFDNLHSNLIINPISVTDDSYTSDSECSSADETTDYNSTETELSSSDESDCEEPKDKSCEQVGNGPFKDFSEDEKLGIVIGPLH